MIGLVGGESEEWILAWVGKEKVVSYRVDEWMGGWMDGGTNWPKGEKRDVAV